MEGLRIFFNQNKVKILAIIVGAIFLILLLQVLNGVYKNQKETSIDEKTVDYNKDYQILSDSRKSEIIYEKETSTLQEFVDYCNAKNYQSAYDMLTDECKQVLYPDIKIFVANYCDTNFKTQKTCKFQAWNTYTYLVEIRDDPMLTGVYDDANYVQDYYTVDEDKISIKGYVRRDDVNKEGEIEGVKVKVNYLDYYIDHTNVNITTSNTSDRDATIGETNNSYGIILTDENDVEHSSNLTENLIQDLIISSGETKELELSFQVGYRENVRYNSMTFKEIYKLGRGKQEELKVRLY